MVLNKITQIGQGIWFKMWMKIVLPKLYLLDILDSLQENFLA